MSDVFRRHLHFTKQTAGSHMVNKDNPEGRALEMKRVVSSVALMRVNHLDTHEGVA